MPHLNIQSCMQILLEIQAGILLQLYASYVHRFNATLVYTSRYTGQYTVALLGYVVI